MRILLIALIAAVLYAIQRRIYEEVWNKNLKISVSFANSQLTEGEEGKIIEVIENRKAFPLLILKVKFQTSRNLEFEDTIGSKTTDLFYRNDIFHIGGGEKITRTLPFRATKRGYYRINNIDLVGTDLFFTTEMAEKRHTDCYLYVYPKVFHSESFYQSLQKLNGEILAKRHLLEDPFEYHGIREYQPYDDIRNVNWKATARTGSLKINQKNYTAMQSIRIFLNTEDSLIIKKGKEVEASIQIAIGLVTYFLSQNRKVSFFANGKDMISGECARIDGGTGTGQLETINKALSRLDTKAEPYNFCELFSDEIMNHTDSMMTLFVSPNGYDDFVELLQNCTDKNIAYTWFYPTTGNSPQDIPQTLEDHIQLLYLK